MPVFIWSLPRTFRSRSSSIQETSLVHSGAYPWFIQERAPRPFRGPPFSIQELFSRSFGSLSPHILRILLFVDSEASPRPFRSIFLVHSAGCPLFIQKPAPCPFRSLPLVHSGAYSWFIHEDAPRSFRSISLVHSGGCPCSFEACPSSIQEPAPLIFRSLPLFYSGTCPSSIEEPAPCPFRSLPSSIQEPDIYQYRYLRTIDQYLYL